MSEHYNYRSTSTESRRRRRKKLIRNRILLGLGLAVLSAGLFFGVREAYRGIRNWVDWVMNDEPETTAAKTTEAETTTEPYYEPYTEELAAAEKLAASYDYDGALALLMDVPGYENSPYLTAAVDRYLEIKTGLVKADITKVYHVFFHSLIADTAKAFAAPKSERDGYNQVMTTVSEFKGMMQQMYDKGYVLVKMHDLAYTNANGEFVKGSILLPEGKIPFVLSVDDMVYYEYMEGDGFASRMVIGEDGYPTCEMDLEGGTTVTGAYDVVPILEEFIAEHPDFSYKGARGVIALTGYDGIMGYRTAPKYGDPTSPDYKASYASIDVEAERTKAKAVAARMKEVGWEFASHSWGHINMGEVDMGWLKTDCAKWEEQVDTLLGGDTDIMIYAFGADIGSWRNYSLENERFAHLKSLGFKYFCNVDGYNIPWVQFSSSLGYIRQGRLNLDGYEMYYCPDKCRIFFEPDTVFDKSRPLPVPNY